jgi:VWFA-related protein
MDLSRSNRWPAVAFCLGISVLGQDPEGAAGRGSGNYALTTGTELVTLPVAVVDKGGKHVSGLRKENFRVEENGRPQEITVLAEEEVPITLGLVVDRSGSMGPKRIALSNAVEAFLKTRTRGDELFLVLFNEDVSLGLEGTERFTDEAKRILVSLRQTVAAGQTALYDALITAVKYLNEGSHARKALVVFSDGGDNASLHKLEDAVLAVQRSSAILYTVGLFDTNDRDQNPGVLKRLAAASGGLPFLSPNAETLDQVCRKIAEDLRSRYVVGYRPSDRSFDGSFRKVEVKVNAPGRGKVKTRTRAGYWTPLPQAKKVEQGQ